MPITEATWDFPRHISSIAILVGLGCDYGLSVQQSLAGTGLVVEDLTQPERLVEAALELQVIRNLQLFLGRHLPMGLEAGMRYRATTFGIWGFAILSSVTARQAMEVGVRYVRLTSAFCNPRLEDTGEELLLIADVQTLPQDVRQFLLERDAASTVSFQRSVLPINLPLTRLECSFPAPTYANKFNDFFGIPALFNQAHDCIGIHSALGDLRLPHGDSTAMIFCEEECQRMLANRQIQAGVMGAVRAHLLRSSRQMPTMELMAEKFAVTARTLRRRLRAEGTDYQTLVEETRQALAEELLKTTDFTITDIAERLGYSESTNFVRAFKRWHGVAPLRYGRRENIVKLQQRHKLSPSIPPL